jgi:hypothetical protein
VSVTNINKVNSNDGETLNTKKWITFQEQESTKLRSQKSLKLQ